ncbi:MAG TPA: hypothetical protein VF491_15170 [Vicinamibacterales bacterium]
MTLRQAQGQPEQRRGLNERSLRIVLAVSLFLYVLVLRTYDVATTFLMLGEQIRDWTIALGSITDLPLVGAPSTAGGRGFGPAYYWLLWIGRFTIGPFLDNLPHAGGITVALYQSIADAWLFYALSRRVHWALALALVLLIASAPFDIALSSLIWNPPVAAALIKMATASALTLEAAAPMWRIGMTAMLAWLAVQAHLSAFFVAAPLLAAIAAQPFVERSQNLRRAIVERTAVIGVVILLLQIPFILSMLREPAAAAGPTTALAGLTNPQAFKPWSAYDSVTSITGNLVLPMYQASEFAIPVLVALPVVLLAWRKDLPVIAVTAGGIVTATILFTTSTRAYDGYWFVTLTTAFTLLFGMAIAAIPSKAAVKWFGFALLAFVIWRQPVRLEESKRFFKYPQYASMVRGSRELVVRAPVVKDIKVTFDVHPTMDRLFVYKILGGRIDPSALYTAIIDADGTVRLE